MDTSPLLRDEPILLAHAQEGDAEAFCQLAECHETRLVRQAFSLCHDLSGAQDLVQQTLIEAWKHLHRFNGRCRFSTWLFSILLHRYQKSVRYARSRPISWSALPPPPAELSSQSIDSAQSEIETPDQILACKEKDRALHQLLVALSPKHQQIIWLRFFEEASLEEIAAVLQLPLGTVKSRLHHGLEKLRQMSLRMNLFDPEGHI